MTFDDVFDTVALDTVLSVSNGKPAPPVAAKLRYDIWRSHNFTGPLRAKLAATETHPRLLRIEAVNEGGVVVAYDIADGGGHAFAEPS